MINELMYISQWDNEANASNNDCGPASLAMVLKTYGVSTTVNEVLNRCGGGKGYISFQQLIAAAQSYGYTASPIFNASVDQLRKLLDQGLCPIVLVQYGFLKSTQDKAFKGPHLMPVTGYRDDGFFANDPNFWGSFRQDGKNHFYTYNEFTTAWGSTTTDGNVPYSLLVVYPKNKPYMPMQISPELYTELVKKSSQWDKVADYLGIDKQDAAGGDKAVAAIKEGLETERSNHKLELSAIKDDCQKKIDEIKAIPPKVEQQIVEVPRTAKDPVINWLVQKLFSLDELVTSGKSG